MNIEWKIVPARELASLAASWDALQARRLPHAFLRTHFLLPLLEQHPLARKVRWSIDIDPLDMF